MNAKTQQQSTSTVLPQPGQRPGTDVVIYDGDCVICTGGVKILNRLDWFKRLSYLSLHDSQVSEVAPDLTFEQMMEEIWVIDHLGRRHSGAGAFRYLTRRLVLLWPVMPLLHIPGSLPLWKWLYQKVAAARYRFGKMSGEDCGDACELHFGARKPEEKAN
ncbi:thiol-disulfide oxidoreductase DCC family protein [Blastopirellula marina]|uniref:DUF393 domain-containing protein n=1 Tax=Blastopirellula marina TaxID=124 RepID=A0A2S8G1P2_9BACT|nr:DUF393 domain-containing protein [Blastopirellula marina]PQO38365.1 DUF393 domain-containing protein [Blastopirellula marina]PTL45022.1 DUF393 domain-containing protein [Blastopirellula marina]